MSDKDKPVGQGGSRPTEGAPTTGPAAKVGAEPSNPPAPPTATGVRAGHEAQPGSKPPAPPAGGPPPKPAPKNPGLVTFTVNGLEVVVKPGTNMIEAAKQVGVEIPYYCYHPRLSIAANCRMCLVEASNAPKLVPACQTPCAEGVAVKTDTFKVVDQERATMEFYLLNHPVDCAICDQAGECKLQDYYMRYDAKPSRLEGQKVLKNKRKVLGPLVVLDQERCILCTRCVRFMAEIPQEPQLGVFGRGSHEVIDVFPGAELTSNYAGNTVDICPVGALLNRDFRFKARAWFLSAAPSVCTGCSRGCSTYVDFFDQDTYRYRPRENEAINKSWMCDQGRVSYKYLSKGRVKLAYIGRGADVREATRAEALKELAAKLAPLKGKIAVLASPLSSNEDLLASLAFAQEVLGVKELFVGGRPSGAGDHLLMTADKNPNRKGLEWVAAGLGLALRPFEELSKGIDGGKIKALYSLGAEVPVDAGKFAQSLQKLELLVVQAINENAITAQAHYLLPATPHTEDEGTFSNLDGITQRFRKAYPGQGESQPHWKWASDLMNELGLTTRYNSAREVFRALSARVPELKSFEWDKNAPPARERGGVRPLPTGADGRPMGRREFGEPRVRGI